MLKVEVTNCITTIEQVISYIRSVLTKDLIDPCVIENVNKFNKNQSVDFVLNSHLYGQSKHSVEAFYSLVGRNLSTPIKSMHAKDIYNNDYWGFSLLFAL